MNVTSHKECTPTCRYFKCTANPNAMKMIQRGSKKKVWCTMVDDECDGHWCRYSQCAEKKMSSDGLCRRETTTTINLDEVVFKEDYEDPHVIPRKYAKKLRERHIE